jgi:hypothetical protein
MILVCPHCGERLDLGKKTKMKVRYIGTKPTKTDAVCGSGLTWVGHGDVQEVLEVTARKLATFPDVWEIVGEEGNVKKEDSPAPSVHRRCAGLKANGEPCHNYVVGAVTFCRSHVDQGKEALPDATQEVQG